MPRLVRCRWSLPGVDAGCTISRMRSRIAERLIVEHPLIREPAEIKRLVLPVQEQLGDAASDRRCVLQPVSRESCRDVEVLRPSNPPADDRIRVQAMDVVVTRPASSDLECFKRRNAMRDARPDDAVEPRMIDLPG